VVFGGSGYGGSAIVVSSAQYVFVPTNRFVGVNVASVRVATQQNATIFRQTTPVTRFAVSGGYVHNTAIPMETIQRATGARIETRNIRDARATPHSMSAGKSQRVSVVAPAREVNAAVASRPQSTQSSPVTNGNGQKHHKSEVNQTTERAASESQQGSQRGNPNQEQSQRTTQTREAPPAQTHDQSRSSSSHSQNAHKAPAQVEAPPPPSGQHHESAPVQGRSESMAQPAHQAPAHASQQPEHNQGAKTSKKQPEKDKKADKGKDEKAGGPSSPKDKIGP
jgi:hypothetical protein